jgi:hypothetical protein
VSKPAGPASTSAPLVGTTGPKECREGNAEAGNYYYYLFHIPLDPNTNTGLQQEKFIVNKFDLNHLSIIVIFGI